VIRGSCLCGEVVFELAEPLSGIELCHCRKCRKAYGAPFAATLYCPKRRFKWIRGKARVTTYDAPLEELPPAYRHSFCATCGSALPLMWDQLPFVEVPASSLDAAVGSRPAYQMFECQRLEWIEDTSGLRWYERGAPLSDKVVREVL
jgi:hypothetical protein